MGTIKEKSQFYDTFKMGIEIEMELPSGKELQDRLNLEWIGDGSIQQKNNGRCIELINHKPFKSLAEEDAFMAEMRVQLGDFRSSNGERIFAYKNNTAGTHIHFSFKDKADDCLWIFDTIDFQQDFFNAYMSRFQSTKFLERINQQYCKAPFLYSAKGAQTVPKEVREDLRKLNLPNYVDEKQRIGGNGSRYRWLNMEALEKDSGVELRIFPHIQTYSGVKAVMDFTREIINKHYWKASTQEKLKLIEFYNSKIRNKPIKSEKLQDLKKLAWDALKIGERNKDDLSGEIRLLISKWVMKQPTLIKAKDEVI
mgnify:CR=1 FL=1